MMLKARGRRSPPGAGGSGRNPTLGGYTPPTYGGGKATSGTQLDKYNDPGAPSPIPPSTGQYSSFDVGNLMVPTITAASTAPGLSVTLPVYKDIVELSEDVTHTFTGTVTTTILFNKLLDHFTIADATGAVVWNQTGGIMQELTNIAFTSPTAGGSLGGADTLLSNQTTAQENLSFISGLRLPASRGPFKFTPTYASYATSGGTQVTADSPNLALQGHYSNNVGGVVSYYLEQTVTLNQGYNYFNQFAAVKNVQLAALFINGITLANIDELYIEQNGSVIEPKTTGLNIQRRMTSAWPAVTIPTNAMILANPVLRSKFAINDASSSRIHVTAAQTNTTFGYYWLARA